MNSGVIYRSKGQDHWGKLQGHLRRGRGGEGLQRPETGGRRGGGGLRRTGRG